MIHFPTLAATGRTNIASQHLNSVVGVSSLQNKKFNTAEIIMLIILAFKGEGGHADLHFLLEHYRWWIFQYCLLHMQRKGQQQPGRSSSTVYSSFHQYSVGRHRRWESLQQQRGWIAVLRHQLCTPTQVWMQKDACSPCPSSPKNKRYQALMMPSDLSTNAAPSPICCLY